MLYKITNSVNEKLIYISVDSDRVTKEISSHILSEFAKDLLHDAFYFLGVELVVDEDHNEITITHIGRVEKYVVVYNYYPVKENFIILEESNK